MAGNTVRLHRVLRAPPERVFRAFITPDALVKWNPPHEFTATIHEMDVRVGGRFHMAFTNFTTGQTHSFGGEYTEIIPNERLRYTDKFDDPGLPGTLEVTVTFAAVSCGTELTIEQSGIPEVIPVEMCYLGWQESLSLLTLLVEPEIRQ